MKPNPELEKAILANPSSPDAWAVYGDWLTEQGDPLGELVAVEIALAATPNDPALLKKDAELKAANEDAWLGELTGLDKDELETTWRFGFLDAIKVGSEEHSETDGPSTITSLLGLSTARFLRDLHIRMFGDDDGQPSYDTIIAAMAENELPPTLRKLAFDVGSFQISWTSLGELDALYAKLAGLEELRLKVGKMGLGTIALPRLKTLVIETPGLTRENVAAINAASWPYLETLVLYTGAEEYGSTCGIDDLAPILSGAKLPKVRTLALCNSEFANEIAKAVVHAPIVRQLVSLDLSKGTMTDEGAEALLAGQSALAHLEHLDVTENFLSAAMTGRLEAAFGARITAGEQGDSEDDWRYVQVAE